MTPVVEATGLWAMLLVVALLVVLIVAGAGFALHVLWVIAVILLCALAHRLRDWSRRRSSKHGFYRW